MGIGNMDMGQKSNEIFHGLNTSESSHLTYAQSTELVADWLRQKISGVKVIVDIGSHSGSFLSAINKKIDLSQIKKVAIESNQEALNQNTIADEKIVANAEAIPLPDNFSDVTILRYVLQWNHKHKQRQILEEALRVTKNDLVLQLPIVSKEDQDFFHKVFSTIDIERLRRDTDFYFPTEEEINALFSKITEPITVNQLQNIVVTKVVDVFKDRYALNEDEKARFAQQFAGHDNWTIMSWVLEKIPQTNKI